MEGPPVDRVTRDVERAERLQRMDDVVSGSPERRDQVRIAVERHALASHAEQRGAGSDLEEGPLTLRVQGRDPVREPDGLADVIAPVAPVEKLVGADDLAADVRDDRDASVVERGARGRALELVEHGIHERRVERVGHVERTASHPCGLEPLGHVGNGMTLAGDHDALGTVHGGDIHGVGMVGEGRLDSFDRCEHDGHRTISGEGSHEAPPFCDQTEPVLQAEHTRDARGGILTDAVPQHDGGLDAP